jgi:hypothetical protein
MAGTLLRLGWTDPRTGFFGAHPQLGGPLDLNDGVTFTLLDGELDIAPPPRELALSGNVRAQGERGLRALYRHNRRASARLIIGPMASYSDLAAIIRTLSAWVGAPPMLPVTLLWQAPGAASPVYLDVTGMASDIPTAERDWLRLQSEPVELLFIARPGLRGDRVTLQNLVMNPGFEAPSGPGVTVFSDSFASVNAYTVASGTAPSVSAGVLTLPAASIITYGSLAWGAINTLRVRFQWQTALIARFFLHYTNGSNYLACDVTNSSSGLALSHAIGGAATTLASASATLTSGTWYWLTLTQYPGVASNPPLVQATLNADSSGAIGAQLATTGPAATADAQTALTGKAGFQAISASLALGGAFPGVMSVSLFGPGGWTFQPITSGAAPTGIASGAWEQNTANTYPNGPAASVGAARVDLPPAGTVDACWRLYTGGAPAGALSALPVAAPGDVLQTSVWARSSGLSSNALLRLYLTEYDASGTQLRQTLVQTLGGNQAAWVALGGAVTTGASAAYADLMLRVVDTISAGESAGATVWFDNAQVWDQTATGAASMPYCELRFPQAPAQLLVSGLAGDLPAPALVAVGTYLASWPVGSSLTWALARRATASAAAQLTGASAGYQPPNTGSLAPTISSALDSASYGGYYLTTTLSNGFNPRAFSFAPSDMLGAYHLFARAWSGQTTANLVNVQVREVTQQRSQPWFGASDTSDQTGQYNGPWVAPLAAASTWTLADAGQANVPALPAGALTSLAQGYLTPCAQWKDSSTPSAAFRANWQALLPVDGSLLLGVANNPANGPFGVTASWLWLYLDGLLANRGGPADGPAATLSVEVAPLANPARGGGGPGSQSTGSIGVNSGADPYLTLDPTIVCPAGSGSMGAGGPGVNQFTALMADGAGAVLSIACASSTPRSTSIRADDRSRLLAYCLKGASTMARIRPVDPGAAPRGGHGRHHKGRHHHPRAKHPRAKHPRAHKHPAAHAPAHEPVSVRSVWPQSAPTPGAIAALLALDPAARPAAEPLILTGAQHGAIHDLTHDTLDAWTRQRDQALNRVARRPGGLTRLAGV